MPTRTYHPLSTAGLTLRGSAIAAALLCGSTPTSARAEILINLDASALPAGPLNLWKNTGSVAGDFILTETAPTVETVKNAKGVTMSSAGFFTGPVAPNQVTGAGARTIEAWVMNPAGSDFETIIAWGRRGTANSNCSFSHGVHPVWGAFGGWADADLDWGGQNKFGEWNYVVYTYDGVRSSVYSNGQLAKSEEIALTTWEFDDTTDGKPLPFRVGAANNADGSPFRSEPPSFTVARIRVSDTALSADEIRAQFNKEVPDFIPNSADDIDKDGLNTAEELAAGTKADDPDTDRDGVQDGAEVRRLVNGAAAPTNPTRADTDGDGLNDGAENTAKTDPLLPDTDTDSFQDGQEVLHGSDPLSASSLPNITRALVEIDCTRITDASTKLISNGGLLGGSFTAVSPAAIKSAAGVKGLTLTGSVRFDGPTAPGWVTGNGSHTVEAWIYNPVIADEETVFAWGRRGGPDGSNASFNHGQNASYGAIGRWGTPDMGWNGNIVAAQWTHLAWVWDSATLSQIVYKDGVEAANEVLPAPLNVWSVDSLGRPLPFRIGSQSDANGTATSALRGSMTIGRIRVHDRVLDASAILARYNSEIGDFGNAADDADKDGMPNGFERDHPGYLNASDPSDAVKDPDNDNLTNLEEYQAKTEIDNADTDGDEAKDGAEVKRKAGGVSAATNPLVPDTDGDGLMDGRETVSDPLLPDSDSDSFPDGQEVFHGSNPMLAASVPDLSKPVALVDLNAASLAEGPLEAWTNAGLMAGGFVTRDTGGEVRTIEGIRALSLDGTGYYTGPTTPVFMTGDAPRSVDAWIFNPEAADEETILAWGRRGGPDGSNCSFNHGGNALFGAVGHWGGHDLGWSGAVVTGRWTHVAYTYDPATTTATVYSEGVAATTKPLTTPLNTHATNDAEPGVPLPFRLGSQNDGNGGPTGGLRGSMSYARVRIYDGVLSAEAIAKLYKAELGAYQPGDLALETPVLDPTGDKITLKWNGVPSNTYTIEGSKDLNAWTPVSTGFSGNTLTIGNLGSKGLQFYRVRSE